jgi:hypothetical protein
MGAVQPEDILEQPRFPLCAQCHAPMVLDRVEPSSKISDTTVVFRCAECALAEHKTIGELQSNHAE